MALRFVDLLEPVQIQAQHRHHLRRAAELLHHAGQPLGKQHAVGQSGQRVVVRHTLDEPIGPAALGNVVVRRNPAAIRRRLVMDLIHVAVAQRDHRLHGLIGKLDAAPPSQITFLRYVRAGARGVTQVRYLLQRHADPQTLRPEAIHFCITPVEQQQPTLPVEHAQALAHLVQGAVAQLNLHLRIIRPSPNFQVLAHDCFHAPVRILIPLKPVLRRTGIG